MDDLPVIRWTRPDEKGMFTYSYSIVESILTCPVYGLTRYYQRKYYPTKRVIPLEAGSAMHEVFAGIRLWQLWRRQDLYQHFLYHGIRLFNTKEYPTRFNELLEAMKRSRDERSELMDFVFKIINTGEFYDDPSDRARTIANMEESSMRYVDEMMERMDAAPVWVEDVENPAAQVGIEIPFDIIVEWRGRKLRYIGTIDGVVAQVKYPGTAMIDENKTAARLDQAWRQSFEVKSQPTGYCYVGKLITGLEIFKARIIGIKIKQTRSEEDFQAFIVERRDHQLIDWVRSLFFADDLTQLYGADPIDAPQFTHSCNRYFRPCAFIDLCSADPEDKRDIYENSLVVAPLTPSQQRVMENYNDK